MKRGWEVVVASDIEREDLFAEICHEGRQMAEVMNDPRRGTLRIELFVAGSNTGGSYDLYELLAAIEAARGRLEEMGYPEKR